MSKTQIVKTEKLTDHKWLNLYESTFTKDGHEGKWVFASRKRGPENKALDVANAVVIVPILKRDGEEDKLVVIKEYRVPIQDYEYHFPAGLVAPHEDALTAAIRELKEETGFEAASVPRYISPLLPSSAGMTDEKAVMVVLDCYDNGGRQELEHSEEIEVMLCTKQEAKELAFSSDKKVAAKTWPILLLFGGCSL